jgi:hypothetical protein
LAKDERLYPAEERSLVDQLLKALMDAHEEIGQLKGEIDTLNHDMNIYRNRVIELQQRFYPDSPPPGLFET